MIKLTGNGSSEAKLSDAVFSLEKLNLQKFGECAEHLSLDENDDIFDNVSKEKIIMFEYKASYESSQIICKSFGGTLFTPLDNQSLTYAGLQQFKSQFCSRGAYVGLEKSKVWQYWWGVQN